MIYRSNLIAPDLSPYFKLRTPAKRILGHDCPSDPDFLPECSYLSHDEAAILFHIAKAWPGRWVDVGSRLGWSAVHIRAANIKAVRCVDPELYTPEFFIRFSQNINYQDGTLSTHGVTSEEYFSIRCDGIDAAHIDGNHDSPEPTLDAMRAIKAGARVLVWHDFWGQPVADAVDAVIDLGWKCRIYNTPNGMACCWNTDEFTPPDHVPDPLIDWAEIRARVPGFDFGRTC